MGASRRGAGRPAAVLVALLAAAVALASRGANAQGINDPQFKKSVPCKRLNDGNYVWGCSRRYTICSNGREHSMTCYDDLVLNPDNNFCDRPSNVWACNNPLPGALYRARDPFSCAGREDGSYESQACSGQYHVCNGGTRHDSYCPPGLVFDPKAFVCDYAAKCSQTVEHVKPIEIGGQSGGQPAPPASPSSDQSSPSVQLAQTKTDPSPTVSQSGGSQSTGIKPKLTRRFGPSRRSSPYRRNSAGPSYTIAQVPPSGPAPPPPVADTFIVGHGNSVPDGYNNANSNVEFENNDVGASQPQPPPPEFDCAGREDGIYTQDNKQCSTGFWKCANGYTFEYGCPAGLFYESSIDQCLEREYVTACGGTPPQPLPQPAPVAPPQPPAFDCSGKPPGYYESAHCSSAYVACNGGQVWSHNCPAGLVFSEQAGQCVYAGDCSAQPPAGQQPQQDQQQQLQQQAQPVPQGSGYGLPESPPPPPPQDFAIVTAPTQPPTPPTTTQIPTTTKAPFDCNGKPDGYYYKRKCKSSFIICSKGQMSKQECPQGLLFDPNLANCQYADVCGKSTTTQAPTTTTTAAPVTVATTSRPDFNCTGRANGYYAKKPCTSTFYSCAHGYTIQLNCPTLLVWDPAGKVCEYPNVCGSAAATSTTTPTAEPAPAPPNHGAGAPSDPPAPPKEPQYQQQQQQSNKNAYASPPAGQSFKAKPPTGPPKTTPAPTQPTPPPFDCSQLPDGQYAIKPCQNAFAICIAGKALSSRCQVGLVFDAANGFCNYPNNCDVKAKPTTKTTTVAPTTVAGTTTTTTTTLAPSQLPKAQEPSADSVYGLPSDSEAPANPNSYATPSTTSKPKGSPKRKSTFSCIGRPDGVYMAKNCNAKFIRCWHSYMARMSCPGDLVYDVTTQMCEYKSACGKAKSQPVSVEPSYTTTTTTTAAPVLDFNCPADGQFSQAQCQSNYVVCSNGKPHQFHCPGSLLYDESTGQCQHPDQCGKTTTPQPVADDGNEVEDDVSIKIVVAASTPQPSPYKSARQATTKAAPSVVADAISAADEAETVGDDVASGVCGDIPEGSHSAGVCSPNYITCMDGVIRFGSCSDGLIYDHPSGGCLPASKAAGCDSAVAPAQQAPPAASVEKNPYGEVPQINQQTLKRRSYSNGYAG